jgi:hypothetical protein
MPYKKKENKQEYERNYWKLRKAGYSIKDMLESRQCSWCGAEFMPKTEKHKYCENACRQRAFWAFKKKNALQDDENGGYLEEKVVMVN